MKSFLGIALATLLLAAAARVSCAEMENNPAKRGDTPAISGYEQELSKELAREFNGFSPKTDTVGNEWVEFGSGEPPIAIAYRRSSGPAGGGRCSKRDSHAPVAAECTTHRLQRQVCSTLHSRR
jgi:hypothetical protein